jgi:hypothetical protein
MKISNKADSPAILLGNGLNNYSKLPISWLMLLNSLSPSGAEVFLKEKEISYPEFYDALCFTKGKGTEEYISLKQDICRGISLWRGTEKHRVLVEFSRNHSIPILTTNYDLTLMTELIERHHSTIGTKNADGLLFPARIGKGRFTDYYPWSSYYSDRVVKSTTHDFGIWHIHGFCCYKRSLAIGAIDYANIISRLKRFLPPDPADKTESPPITNTWVEIFFNCDLYIVGLSLDSQETSLRWLLMQRERYFRRNETRRRKTVYVVNKQYDGLGSGKAFLFDSLNIVRDEYPDSSSIYDSYEFA